MTDFEARQVRIPEELRPRSVARSDGTLEVRRFTPPTERVSVELPEDELDAVRAGRGKATGEKRPTSRRTGRAAKKGARPTDPSSVAAARRAAAEKAIRAVARLKSVPFELAPGERASGAGAVAGGQRPWLTDQRFLLVGSRSGRVAAEWVLADVTIRRVGVPKGCVQVRIGEERYLVAPLRFDAVGAEVIAPVVPDDEEVAEVTATPGAVEVTEVTPRSTAPPSPAVTAPTPPPPTPPPPAPAPSTPPPPSQKIRPEAPAAHAPGTDGHSEPEAVVDRTANSRGHAPPPVPQAPVHHKNESLRISAGRRASRDTSGAGLRITAAVLLIIVAIVAVLVMLQQM